MGRQQHTKDRRSKFAREEARAARPRPDLWEVRGVSQHGDEISFRETVEAEAIRHAERINSLGGAVCVFHFVWNGPAAEYREASE
jgi:hypothetical protein